jgi:hypothetical protein
MVSGLEKLHELAEQSEAIPTRRDVCSKRALPADVTAASTVGSVIYSEFGQTAVMLAGSHEPCAQWDFSQSNREPAPFAGATGARIGISILLTCPAVPTPNYVARSQLVFRGPDKAQG